MPRSTFIAGLAIATAVAGCGGAVNAQNKAGAPAAGRPTVIRLEANDAGSAEAATLASRIRARSHGALQVELLDDYPSRSPRNEVRLARDVGAGKVDFAILPGRAWAAAGVPAFAALQAPFVIGSYDAARAATSGVAGQLLTDQLRLAGIVPLALVPAELRRVLSTAPLDTPTAYHGRRLRISDNATTAAVVRSLGASPVAGLTVVAAWNGIAATRLDGIETAPVWALANNGAGAHRFMTDYALFDRVDTAVASPAAWKRLSREQQDVLRAAAQDTVGASATLTERDAEHLTQLCHGGVRVIPADPAALQAIANRTEPVRAALRANADTAPVMEALESTPGAGPHVLPIPAACRGGAAPAPAQPVNSAATIPNGTYQVRTTVEDFRRFGLYGPDWEKPVVWTIRIRDGRWYMSQKPDYPDAGPGSGTYTLRGDTGHFRILKPAVDANPPWTVRWSYYKGELTFRVVEIGDIGLRVIYGAHPWKRIG